MEQEHFSSLEQLYQRLLPAFKTKVGEMKREKMIFITEDDLWKYFCTQVWHGKSSITLFEMVNDILNTDNFEIYESIRKEQQNGENTSK